MGFFQKIKENFTHGGVKLQLQAPSSVNFNDPTISVAVSVSSSSKQQVIELISVMIMAESYDKAFSNNQSSTSTQKQEREVARAEYTQPLTVMPGETKSIQVDVIMNQGSSISSQLPEGSGVAQFIGALQKIDTVSNMLGGNGWRYYVKATAKVQGITFGPSCQQPIQILRPGETGASVNLGIHF